MDDKIKQIWPKLKGFFANMSKKTKRLLAVGAGGVVLIAAALLIFLATRPYTTLFTGLTSDNMTAVLNYLNDAGIHSYKIQNGDTILVPSSQEPALKMQLLMEGYPNQDSGYAMYLDNINSLSTNTERQQLYFYDLQERLRAAIRNIEGVRDAVVLLTPGVDNSYVLNRNAIIEATASVQVDMQPGRTLSANQASSIRRLVGNAVQGLVIENVALSDTNGNPYDADLDGLNITDSARLKLALEQQVNNNIRRNVLTVLNPMYGEGNVYVGVTSTVDVSRVYTDDVNYTEPDWAADGSSQGRGIIGSRVYSYNIGREENAPAGGVVGTEPNSDISTYVERLFTDDENLRNLEASGEDNYLVDTTHTEREQAGGTVTDVMVAVSINAEAGSIMNREELVGHIARLSGITPVDQDAKVSLMVGQFWTPPTTPIIEPDNFMWMLYAAIAGLIVFLLILLVILLLLRRRRKKKREREAALALDAAAEALAAAQGQSEMRADIMDMHTERTMELRKDVRKFAETNPEIAAMMVKNWLNGEEENKPKK